MAEDVKKIIQTIKNGELPPLKSDIDQYDSYILAQNEIGEIEKQVRLYAAEQLREAIKNVFEKQIPKKIEIIGVKAFCPICGADANSWHLYCHKCGQRLDWSEIYGKENEK